MTNLLAAADPSLTTVGGLPLHPLAVHAVVVLLPLSVIGLIAMILRPQWRKPYEWLVGLGLVAGVGATIVAVQAGEQLAGLTGISEEHRQYGKLLEWLAIALLMVAAGWFMQQRVKRAKGNAGRHGALGRGIELVASVMAILLGVAVLLLSALVGHSGANAVWESKIAAAPTAAPSSNSATGSSYSLAGVRTHASTSDCWSAVDGQVYNLTDWISRHPGGAGVIESMCGADGSAAFNSQHAGAARPAQFLAAYKVGTLESGGSGSTTVINTLTKDGVQTHNTAKSCWSIINGNIYDLTDWIDRHPGGSKVIVGLCGLDGSAAFTKQHGGQGEANQALDPYLLGALKS